MTLIQFDPPKAHPNKVTGSHRWAEPKLDGVRVLVHLHPTEGVVITTRRKNKDGQYTQLQDKLPHLRDSSSFVLSAGAHYTILDGELVLPKGKAKDVMSIVGAHPATAIAFQRARGEAQLALFDCPRYQDVDMSGAPLRERKEALTMLHHELPAPPFMLVAHSWINDPYDESRAAYVQRCFAAGFEGAMWKVPSAPYFGTSWRKVKASETHDLQVVGYTWGEGKYEGQIGALTCYWPDGTHACNVAPGSDADRAQLTRQLTGKSQSEIILMQLWVEVGCQEVTRDRSLRHPRIVKWRPDLAANAKGD